MSNRIIAALALITLGLFIAVVPIFVPDTDLIVLAVFCFLLAVYDFWSDLFGKREGK